MPSTLEPPLPSLSPALPDHEGNRPLSPPSSRSFKTQRATIAASSARWNHKVAARQSVPRPCPFLSRHLSLGPLSLVCVFDSLGRGGWRSRWLAEGAVKATREGIAAGERCKANRRETSPCAFRSSVRDEGLLDCVLTSMPHAARHAHAAVPVRACCDATARRCGWSCADCPFWRGRARGLACAAPRRDGSCAWSCVSSCHTVYRTANDVRRVLA